MISPKKGFTLIEILITIALLGILVSIVSVSFGSSQKKGRDARRKADLAEVKKALETAKNDCVAGSYYPTLSSTYEAVRYNFVASTLRTKGFLQNLPLDPQYPHNHYLLLNDNLIQNVCTNVFSQNTSRGANVYVLRVKLEISTDPDSSKSFESCQSRIATVNYTSNPPAPSQGDGYYYVCND